MDEIRLFAVLVTACDTEAESKFTTACVCTVHWVFCHGWVGAHRHARDRSSPQTFVRGTVLCDELIIRSQCRQIIAGYCPQPPFCLHGVGRGLVNFSHSGCSRQQWAFS